MSIFFTAREQFVHLSALVEKPAHWRALATGESSDEQTIADFTASLQQLAGIPFKYLVPNNAMLPPESIRFFFVDQNWIDALVDGALSLGRIGANDVAHDRALSPVLAQQAEAVALNRRRVQLRRERVDAPAEQPIYGGLLLRSAVVSGWPGLEVQAFEAAEGSGVNTKCSGAPIDLVRMDRLSEDVLLCLFAKPFGCVNIHEPKEGINLGANAILPNGTERVDQVDPDKYTKQLRGLGVGGYVIAEFIPEAVVDVPLRTKASRVVQVDALRQSMVTALKGLHPPAWDGSVADFTSAQFSLEMIEGASQHIFRADSAAAVPRAKAARVPLADQREADRKKLNAFLFGPESEDNA